MVSRKKTDTVQLSKIRLREDLRRKLARDAERNDTTLNGEIAARLERSYVVDEQRQRENALLDLLLGGGEAADLMRRLALNLQRAPNAAKSVLEEAIERVWTPRPSPDTRKPPDLPPRVLPRSKLPKQSITEDKP
jgi:hypothetical protein